jgi:hypothetical protein
MPQSFHQCCPFPKKPRFDTIETIERNLGHLAHKMAMVIPVGSVIAEHAAIVAPVYKRIHVSEAVSHNRALEVDPNLTAHRTASLPPG